MSKTKDKWEELGRSDPYFAVSTFDKFKAGNLTDDAKKEFFASGFDHVGQVWADIEKVFETSFNPENALDFGSGVGRLVIPLASKAAHVTGVDISNEMIAEARRNCADRNIENVEFRQTDEFLSDHAEFDFVHSYIVFQHIDPSVGYGLLNTILQRLKLGGIGTLHFTYATPTTSNQSLAFRIYRDYPLTYKIRQLITGNNESLIPIYLYDLNRIVKELHIQNCHEMLIRTTYHGLYGALITFRKGVSGNR